MKLVVLILIIFSYATYNSVMDLEESVSQLKNENKELRLKIKNINIEEISYEQHD